MPKKTQVKQLKAAKKGLAAAQNIIPPGEEMYYMPAAPDPNTKMTWPQHLAGKIDDGKFICIWPNNINSSKTIAEGRRVPKSHACDDPIVSEMSEVLQYYKFTHVIEPYKVYPRDVMAGRIRIKLTDEDDQPCNADLPTRRALLMKMGELIPKLKIRQRRMAAKQNELEQAKKLQIEQEKAAAAKGKGKKGKKRGK
mmetsp:Transcript_78564/g.225093  ORF Transcript_78564/g.225093 Transcript_78564/m.225093 type:complete len:196 (-) Transcript_78564:34-621(-)|eukprot:CAMPEP_0119504510 /NCGR_PEP_ID=MMETSP1344-20130328/25356_1 /TAXON_ID=236787 /ORGANISM="Florenciella parvula, Strain CCMP2471" /LENGTH=195 /DNA_ID=CAMNT_0007540895 /DNA_START=247 /DNA_END=834 /DNA_ORIENTATION=-